MGLCLSYSPFQVWPEARICIGCLGSLEDWTHLPEIEAEAMPPCRCRQGASANPKYFSLTAYLQRAPPLLLWSGKMEKSGGPRVLLSKVGQG